MSYQFVLIDGKYELQDNGTCILRFTNKEDIRDVLQAYADQTRESSKWVGKKIQQFFKNFPLELPPLEKSTPADYPESVLVQHLRNSGFTVTRPFNKDFSDKEIIKYLINKKWKIELNGIQERSDNERPFKLDKIA